MFRTVPLRTALMICLAFVFLAAHAQAQETLTNESILKLVAANISEELILFKIQNSPGDYKLDTEALIDLKAKRVSDKILQAMMTKMSSTAQPALEPPTATRTASDTTDKRKPSTDRVPPAPSSSDKIESEISEYELLAANKTSTIEKEINSTALRGYRFDGLTFGETLFGGKEVIVIMRKTATRFEYKLLATNKTSTMEKELNESAALGYHFKEASYGDTAAGGKQVITVLERPAGETAQKYSYKLVATSKTSTLRKEMNRYFSEGFVLADITYGDTAFGGQEVIAVLEIERKN